MTRLAWLAVVAIAAGASASRGYAQEPPPLPERETPRPVDDHYQPAALAQAARAYMSAGDLGTAAILLRRAELLAPRDPRVAHGLRELASRRAGTFVSPEPLPPERVPAPQHTPASGPIPPEPPPPWPLR
jgi:hypothetical protein